MRGLQKIVESDARRYCHAIVESGMYIHFIGVLWGGGGLGADMDDDIFISCTR